MAVVTESGLTDGTSRTVVQNLKTLYMDLLRSASKGRHVTRHELYSCIRALKPL